MASLLTNVPQPTNTHTLRDELGIRAQTLRAAGPAMRLWQLTFMALKSSVERQRLTHQWTPDDLQALVADAGYSAQVEHTQHWVIVRSSCRKIGSAIW